MAFVREVRVKATLPINKQRLFLDSNGSGEHSKSFSILHKSEHPSWFPKLPSSQGYYYVLKPSPQIGRQYVKLFLFTEYPNKHF